MTQEVPLTAPDDSGFAARVRSAVAWRWGSQVLAQLITWTSTIGVMRILDPSDYGLFAMTQAVLAALNFLNGYSFATSLIKADDVNERRIAQVFGMLILANAGIALAQFLLAPAAAAYYGQPEVADMLRVQALIFLATPFIALPSALLARRIEFRSQGLINLLCALVGASTALGLAWIGFGVWALVYAPIAMAAVRAIGLTISAKLLVWPVFDFRGAWDILTFGGALTLCQLLWIVQSQSDIFIAGRVLSTHDLGIYTLALFLALVRHRSLSQAAKSLCDWDTDSGNTLAGFNSHAGSNTAFTAICASRSSTTSFTFPVSLLTSTIGPCPVVFGYLAVYHPQ